MAEKIVQGGGVGFAGLLTLIFITLKLIGKVTWSWLWVLSPLWIPLAFVVGLLIVCGVIAVILALWE